MKRSSVIVIILFAVFCVNAQEEATWKKQTHITGYVNTLFEFTDLENWKDAEQDIGIGLSDAAFLVTFKPLKKLEFKGSFVYTNHIADIQSLLVEAYATYEVASAFKLSAGKYLTPLSPINQYFYAPLNPSATLPMVVSHHVFLPQSISGLQISGEFGNSFKAGYNITYGQYISMGHYPQGILGLQGTEDIATVYTTLPEVDRQTKLGGSARIYGNYNDMIKVGLNYFDGRRSTISFAMVTQEPIIVPATLYSFGVDMQFAFAGFRLNGEYWTAKQTTTDLPTEISKDYKAYYAELIYEIGIFSPYVRYDYLNDIKATVYMDFPDVPVFDVQHNVESYTIGVGIRPIYEILVKCEYRYIGLDYGDNPQSIEVDKYNHFILSLVYSF